ncbi:MAG: type II toxin-antitoxin system Phd/YefM family antitoxin [Acidithiobacillus ferrivorans]
METQMTTEYSIADAKNRLPALVHMAERGEVVRITRRGRPVAVILSGEAYNHLADGLRPGVWEVIQSFQERHQADMTEFTDSDLEDLRDRSTGRDAAWQ